MNSLYSFFFIVSLLLCALPQTHYSHTHTNNKHLSKSTGHPFDTIKVRIQASSGASGGIMSMIKEFGGVASLFRGMGAPLSAAAVINAIVFGSYGIASRLYDEHLIGNTTASDGIDSINNDNNMNNYDDYDDGDDDDDDDDDDGPNHDPWQKAMACGSFAGLVQCVVIAPMEHIKCRLQVQQGKRCSSGGGSAQHFKGPASAARYIVQKHGVRRLFQGWWVTCLREVPAFGLYFSVYDYLKDKCNSYLSAIEHPTDSRIYHSHTWLSSAIAGGSAGAVTWGIVYPVDIVKTKIQTMPLNATGQELSMFRVGADLVTKYGWRHLFRGMGITLIRAFPVNGTIFPVYEFTLMRVVEWEKGLQE